MAVFAVYAILAIGAVRTVFAVLSVIDRDRRTLGEGNRVTDGFAVAGNRCDACHVVVVLQGSDDGLQCRNVGVHLLAKLLQLGHSIFEPVNAAPNAVIVVLARRKCCRN